MKISKSDPILIIGAGISGLATAVTLYHQGFSNLRIFDKTGETSSPDAPLYLGANALHALESITLGEVVRAEGSDWERMEWRWRSDSVIKSVDVSPFRQALGFVPITTTYNAFREAMLREMPAEFLQPEAEFISFTQSSKVVEAQFADNRREAGELLIGADGLRSRVRFQVLGDDPIRTYDRIYVSAFLDRDHIPNPGLESIESPFVEWVGKGKSFGLSRYADTGIACQMSLPLNGQMPGALKPWLQGEFEHWESPIPDLLTTMDERMLQTWQPADRRPVKGWYKDRVVLTGDAAHPTVPFLGMGADMAIESGVMLGMLISETGNLKKAFKAYEKARRKRTRMAMAASARYIRFLNKGNRISYLLRSMLPLVPGYIDVRTIQKLQGSSFRP